MGSSTNPPTPVYNEDRQALPHTPHRHGQNNRQEQRLGNDSADHTKTSSTQPPSYNQHHSVSVDEENEVEQEEYGLGDAAANEDERRLLPGLGPGSYSPVPTMQYPPATSSRTLEQGHATEGPSFLTQHARRLKERIFRWGGGDGATSARASEAATGEASGAGEHVALMMDQEGFPVDHNHGQVREEEDDDERRCRICLETEDDKDSESGQLISPCLCKGSSRFIHLGCLEKWRELSPRKSSAFSCDTCHYHYSFTRPFMANILGHAYFLHIITLCMFTALCYGSAWIGREINAQGLWEWKGVLVGDPQADLGRFLGLDYLDLLWGFGMVASMGLIFLCSHGVSSLCHNEDDENSGRGCDCGGCGPCYCGECGAAGGAEGLLILMVVVAFLAGTVGAFAGIYRIMARFNAKALESMKETILEVK